MQRALEIGLRRLGDIWDGMAPAVGEILSYVELWHVCLFIVGLWLLSKLTGPGFYGR
jgi:hypothetical protein